MGIMRRGRARPISDSGNRGPSLSLVPTIIILSFQLDLRNSNDNPQVKDKCKILEDTKFTNKQKTQRSDNFLSSSNFHSSVSTWYKAQRKRIFAKVCAPLWGRWNLIGRHKQNLCVKKYHFSNIRKYGLWTEGGSLLKCPFPILPQQLLHFPV